MFKPSIMRPRPPGVVVGWVGGILTSLLVAAPVYWKASTSSELTPFGHRPELAAFPVAGAGSRDFLQVLPALCKNTATATAPSAGFRSAEDGNVIVWQQARSGVENARRLLPLARRLTLQALRRAGPANRLGSQGLTAGKRRISAVRRVVLDPQLGSAAEVRRERPGEIRVGPDYAMNLTSDDEAIFLLGHELTHVAAWSGRLRGFIESLADKARFTAGVDPSGPRAEDLACEFIAGKVLKSFADLEPTGESKAERLVRVLGYHLPPERLQFAWDEFCATYYGDYSDPGDDEHLSQNETLRALRGLDPELRTLVLNDLIPATP